MPGEGGWLFYFYPPQTHLFLAIFLWFLVVKTIWRRWIGCIWLRGEQLTAYVPYSSAFLCRREGHACTQHTLSYRRSTLSEEREPQRCVSQHSCTLLFWS